MSIKRASLSEDVASGIVFVKETIKILKKYYTEVASGLPECFSGPSIGDEIDV